MPSRATLLDAHAGGLERAEAREVRRVAAAYRQARQEIVDRLVTQWNGLVGQRTLTPEQAAALFRQSSLLQQIDARLQQLENELGMNLRSIVNSSSELAVEQVRQELALLPPTLRPDHPGMFTRIDTRMVEQFVPVAMHDVQLGTRALSLTIQRELQTGLLQGESLDRLVGRVMAPGVTGNGASPWRRGELSAELATRRLVITSGNGAKQAALQEAQQVVPAIQKQAVATIGPNTTDCCLRVHGQIQPIDQLFELIGTPRFADRMQYPGFHWCCRTGITMWHPVFERSGLTTANMRKSAEAQLAQNGGRSGGN
ncbi:MAG: hypothetical protein U0350_36315 [Caldilineaceae bacterium]